MFGLLLQCDICTFSSLVTSTFIPETWTTSIDSRRIYKEILENAKLNSDNHIGKNKKWQPFIKSEAGSDV